jgi:hypothetical protein
MHTYGKGALIGAATVYVVPSFMGTVGRFVLYNCIEIVVLLLLSSVYGGLTNRAGNDKLTQLATPKESQLRVINPRLSGRYLALTFSNDSTRAIQNISLHCSYDEMTKNAYEDVSRETYAITTRWVMGRFEPKTAYQLSVPIEGYPSANPAITQCKVFYDDFTVEMIR